MLFVLLERLFEILYAIFCFLLCPSHPFLGGYRNISNEYNITTKIDREHPELRKYAQRKNWWNGKSQFNFAAVYSYKNTSRIEASGSRYCEGKKLLQKSHGEFLSVKYSWTFKSSYGKVVMHF